MSEVLRFAGRAWSVVMIPQCNPSNRAQAPAHSPCAKIRIAAAYLHGAENSTETTVFTIGARGCVAGLRVSLPMRGELVMTIVLAPETVEAPHTSEYHHRLLFPSGTTQNPGSEFSLRATLTVSGDGGVAGPTYRPAVRVHGSARRYWATEWVRGFVRGRDVELDGYQVESGLSPDSYRLTLSGNGEAGTFGGSSRTYHNN
jgi:hypothetical protein